jgi:hypothetical protein
MRTLTPGSHPSVALSLTVPEIFPRAAKTEGAIARIVSTTVKVNHPDTILRFKPVIVHNLHEIEGIEKENAGPEYGWHQRSN